MTDNIQIVIPGGRGMLGTDLSRACAEKGIGAEVLDLPEFDITEFGQLEQAVRAGGDYY